MFPQRDANGDESYPAFFVDEFIASLPGTRRRRLFDKDLLGLPVDVAARASRIGEDDIACCLASAVVAPADVVSFPTAQRGLLSVGDVLCGMRTVEEDGEAVAVLSPRQSRRIFHVPIGGSSSAGCVSGLLTRSSALLRRARSSTPPSPRCSTPWPIAACVR